MRNFNYYTSHLIPITLLLCGSWIFSLLLGTKIPEFEGEIKYTNWSILYILLFLLLSSLVLMLNFNIFSQNKIRFFYGSILGLALFELFMEIIYFHQFLSGTTLFLLNIFLIIYSLFIINFMFVYISGKVRVNFRNGGILLTSLIIGRQLAIMMELKLLLISLIILALFDIYSVFRGPLSRVIGKPKKVKYIEINELVMNQQLKKVCEKGTPVYISRFAFLGIGDTLFFSVIMVKVLLEWGIIALLSAYCCIVLGAMGTLFFLKRISPLPALPLPIFFSLFNFAFFYFL